VCLYQGLKSKIFLVRFSGFTCHNRLRLLRPARFPVASTRILDEQNRLIFCRTANFYQIHCNDIITDLEMYFGRTALHVHTARMRYTCAARSNNNNNGIRYEIMDFVTFSRSRTSTSPGVARVPNNFYVRTRAHCDSRRVRFRCP
jgi:hypothetical protein